MRAIVLAAGLGARLWPLSTEVPKPLLPVGNVALLQRIFDQLVAIGCSELMLNIFHEAELVRNFAGTTYRGARITTFQENRLTGPAGGARRFLDRLSPGEH